MTEQPMSTPGGSPTWVRPMTIVATHDVSERTVRRWIKDGTVESVRIGSAVFVSVESLNRLFAGAK